MDSVELVQEDPLNGAESHRHFRQFCYTSSVSRQRDSAIEVQLAHLKRQLHWIRA